MARKLLRRRDLPQGFQLQESSPAHSSRCDFQVFRGDVLVSGVRCYLVESFVGEGSFGKVAKCTVTTTNELVAVKIIKSQPQYINQAKHEVDVLRRLSALDPDMCNIVRWHSAFQHKQHICLEFELLDMSLLEFVRQRGYQSLPLDDVRIILHEVAIALGHLKLIGIIHADLKPENIMLVDNVAQPLQVKLIDFGEACHVSQAWTGCHIQTRWYRSPEVMLGLPWTEAVDMWSLGCVAAEIFLGNPLYPGHSEYDMMRFICESRGQPADQLLNVGVRTPLFFTKNTRSYGSLWRLKTLKMYEQETGISSAEANLLIPRSSRFLDDLVPPLDIDRMDFVALVKRMLHVDSTQRITPAEVLEHPFMTGHLIDSCHFEGFSQSPSCSAERMQTKEWTRVQRGCTDSSDGSPAISPAQKRKRGCAEFGSQSSSFEGFSQSPGRSAKRTQAEEWTGVQQDSTDSSSSSQTISPAQERMGGWAEFGSQISSVEGSSQSPGCSAKRTQAEEWTSSDGSPAIGPAQKRKRGCAEFGSHSSSVEGFSQSPSCSAKKLEFQKWTRVQMDSIDSGNSSQTTSPAQKRKRGSAELGPHSSSIEGFSESPSCSTDSMEFQRWSRVQLESTDSGKSTSWTSWTQVRDIQPAAPLKRKKVSVKAFFRKIFKTLCCVCCTSDVTRTNTAVPSQIVNA